MTWVCFLLLLRLVKFLTIFEMFMKISCSKGAVVFSALVFACFDASAATVSASLAYDTLGLSNTGGRVPASVSAPNNSMVHRTQWDFGAWDPYRAGGAYSSVSGKIQVDTSLTGGGRIDAVSTWSDTFTNLGSSAQRYGFNFEIEAVELEVGGWTGNLATRDFRSGFSASVLVNGTSVWNTSQVFLQDANGVRLEKTGFDIGDGVVTSRNRFSPRYMYSLAPFSGTANLGSFAAGETFSVTYMFSSFSYWDDPDGCNYECGVVSARASDPFGVNGGERLSVQPEKPVGTVSEPEIYPMLLVALGVMANVMRRRRLKGS